MKASDVVKKAQEEFGKLSKTPLNGVAGVTKSDEGWVIMLEALERRAIPDSMDLLGLYEMRVDDEGNFLGMERKKLRKRCDTAE